MQLLLVLLFLLPMPGGMWEVGKGWRAVDDHEDFGEKHSGEGLKVSFPQNNRFFFFFRLHGSNLARGGDGEQ